MKLFLAFTFLVSSILTHADAPPHSRGPRYNPPSGNRGTVTRPAPTPSRPSGPRYNPPTTTRPSRPTPGPVVTRPTPTPSRPTGPRYNPPTPSRPTPGPVVTRPTPRPRPTPTPTPGSYNPRPRGPRYNPPQSGHVTSRPSRTYYGTSTYHRPYGHSHYSYRYYSHVPYRTYYSHSRHYYRTYDWYSYVWSSFPQYVYVHWIFYPATGYNNGYWVIDNYPYYVFNGYRHRYSHYDYCNYQLVDSWNHDVVSTYWNQLCSTGYDTCSFERDRLNSSMGEFRYFCSETYRNEGYDYSTPTYDTSYDDNTCQDWDNDGYCD